MYMKDAETLGTAVWADIDDIASRYAYNPETDFFIGRNPYNYNQPIGVDATFDDRHVFLCAGSRGGKGRAIVVPNLLNWRGSLVSADPKGENASVSAARRANGDAFCDGLGQKTYVLDPYRKAKIPEELRASCNLMDVLDAKSGSLLSECEVLANAMRMPQEGGESESWSRDAAQITGLVIAHVKTFKGIKDEYRDLVMVREFLVSGQMADVERIEASNREELKRAKTEGRDPKLESLPDPYEELFRDMQRNTALQGAISRRARGLLNLMRSNVRQWGSLIQNARTETNFIDDLQMVEQLDGSARNKRSFTIADLRHDPKGISVFLCLPDKPSHPAIRWQKALLTLILDYMGEEQGIPATDQQVLMVLDEFASMGKMDQIANGMNSIAGAGVKLFVIVTNLADLKHTYDKAWPKLLAGCGLQMWFQIDDLETTGPYIEKAFGETQVVLHQRSESRAQTEGESETESQTEGEGWSTNTTQGQSHSTSESTSKARSQGHNQSMSFSESDTWQQGDTQSASETRGRSSSWQMNSSTSRGGSSGRNSGSSNTYNYNGLFDPFVRSTNSGRNSGTSSGSNWGSTRGESRGGGINLSGTIGRSQSRSRGGSRGRTRQHGSSQSVTDTFTLGETNTLSKSYSQGRSGNRSETRGRGRNRSETWTQGMQESIHKRPLITIPEQNRWLKRVDVRDDPTYPGFALVRISGEDPFLARKCYYDQDHLFEGQFTPHYAHRQKFLPYSKQRLVGGEYTADHFLPIRIPVAATEASQRIDVDLTLTTDDWFEEHDELFVWTGPSYGANADALDSIKTHPNAYNPNHDRTGDKPYREEPKSVDDIIGEPVRAQLPARAPGTGKVIDYALPQAYREDGDIMLLRMERVFSEKDRQQFEFSIFFELMRYLRSKGAKQEEIIEFTAELNRRYHGDWLAYRDRQERQKAEAERQAKEHLGSKEQAKAKERSGYIKAYRMTFILCLVLPIMSIFGALTNVLEGGAEFTGQYAERSFLSPAGETRSICHSSTYDRQQHWLFWGRETYKCKVRTGITSNVPMTGYGLAFQTVFGWGIIFIVILIIQHVYLSIQQANRDSGLWEDQTGFRIEGYEAAKKAIGKHILWIAPLTIGMLVIYHLAVQASIPYFLR